MTLLILGLVFAIFLAGCISSGQLTSSQPQTLPPQSQPTETYECPDKSIVTDLSKCPKCPKSCDDNNSCTIDTCDKNTGYRCRNLVFEGPQIGCSGEIEGCMEKTCSAGVCTTKKQAIQPECRNDSDCDDKNIRTSDICTGSGSCTARCEHDLAKCPDGTQVESCSNNKPKYCNSTLQLIDKASKCGCDTTDYIYIPVGETCRNYYWKNEGKSTTMEERDYNGATKFTINSMAVRKTSDKKIFVIDVTIENQVLFTV